MEDPTEQGIRKALNFGHTIGHAVETNSLLNDEKPLTHGEAIAIGMICESYLSYKKTGLSNDELAEIVTVIGNLYPKYHIEATSHEALCALMLKDKKNQNGKINCTLLINIGQFSLDNICTDAELCESLSYYTNL
jgi:3-dehydroquinate synthase